MVKSIFSEPFITIIFLDHMVGCPSLIKPTIWMMRCLFLAILLKKQSTLLSRIWNGLQSCYRKFSLTKMVLVPQKEPLLHSKQEFCFMLLVISITKTPKMNWWDILPVINNKDGGRQKLLLRK